MSKMKTSTVRKNNAAYYEPGFRTLKSAGIDPETGLPTRVAENSEIDACCGENPLVNGIYNQLEVMDRQDFVNRVVWYNLPDGLDGELIERILYYRWKGMFFHMKSNDKFYFLPFALNGSIDVYGRYTGITPLPFNGTTYETDEEGKQNAWIQGLIKKPINSIEDLFFMEDIDNACVILNDYSKGISQEATPRYELQKPILKAMAEVLPLAQTNLVLGNGVRGLKVQDESEARQAVNISRQMKKAALNGKPFIPMIAKADIQDLGKGSSVMKSEEFLIYLQALDNYRLSLYGLKNGGLFQKKSHMLESEQEMNQGQISLVYDDTMYQRQKFCDLVNSIWGLGIWCEPSESVSGMDSNGDGTLVDQQDQTGVPGTQPDVNMGGN